MRRVQLVDTDCFLPGNHVATHYAQDQSGRGGGFPLQPRGKEQPRPLETHVHTGSQTLRPEVGFVEHELRTGRSS